MDRLQGGPSINPQTGAREYFSLGGFGTGLARAAGGIVGNIVGGPVGAAIGSAAATALTGGDLVESATNGLLGGLGAYMGGTDMSALGLGTSSLFGSLGGETLRHVGGAGSGASNFAGGGFGSNLWNGLTSGSGLAALGIGGLLMSPSDKPPVSPTAGASGNGGSSIGRDRVNIDVEPFDRQRRQIGRDPYTYGQTGGESQMFDVVNPVPVFKARGGRVKGDTIPGNRYRSQGLGRYADGGDVRARDYYELDRPAETYDEEGEHKFFGDQRFADIALGGLSDAGTPRTPTNPGGGSTGIPNEYGGKGTGMSPPSPGDFSVNDPDKAAAQIGAAEEGIGVLGALGVPGIGMATGITGALSAMGVHGVLSEPDVSEYDEGARQAHQAAIDEASVANKDIPIGDIAIGALMGALSPPGVDLAGALGIGVGGSAPGSVGPAGVGGSIGAPTGTPGSGDIGTVGGTSEAGPGTGGNPGTGGGAVGGDMGGGSGGVTGGTGQPGSADGPGIWRTGGKVRRYADGGQVRHMASGGLAEYLRSYNPFGGDAHGYGLGGEHNFFSHRFGSGTGAPPPAGGGGGSGVGTSPPPATPATPSTGGRPRVGGGRFNGIGRTNPSATTPGQHSDAGQALGALGGLIGGPFGAAVSFGVGMADKYSGVNDGADASQYSGPHPEAAQNRRDLEAASKEADAINAQNDVSLADGILAGVVNMLSPPGFSATTRSPVSVTGRNTGGATGMGGTMSGGFGGNMSRGLSNASTGRSTTSSVSVGGSRDNDGSGMAGGFGGAMGGGGGGRGGSTGGGGAPQGGRSGGPRGYADGGRLRANLGSIQRLAEGGSPTLPSYGQGPMFQFFRDRMGRPGTPDAPQTGGQGGAPAAGGLGAWARGRFDGSRLPENARTALTGAYNRMGGEGAWEPGAIFRHLAQRANPRGYGLVQQLLGHLRPAQEQQPLAGGGRPRGAVKGPGTGQSDDIPAMLSDGEYVMDAESVSALGDGSNDAGAKKLDEMRQRLRQHKRGAAKTSIPPKAKAPDQYLRGGKKGGKKNAAKEK